MRIRALSVFEGVVHHCFALSTENPCRPVLEVDALLREGDADATSGPLLVTVADYIAMVGDLDVARCCLKQLEKRGRIVERLGLQHLSFPTWTKVSEMEPAESNDGAETQEGIRPERPG